ncbi:zinc finger, C3HC4 type [Cooperia oncophora]
MAQDSDDDECPVCAQRMILPTAVPVLSWKVSVTVASLGPASKRARVCSDEAGPSSRTKTREHSNEQEYESPQREPETSATSSERYYWLYEGPITVIKLSPAVVLFTPKMAQDSDDDECPVCAQKMILPTAVPGCGHKFCFLCIKGAAFRTQERLCPMCRGNVSVSIFRSPAMRNVTLDMHDPESPTVTRELQKSKSDGTGWRFCRVLFLLTS